MDFEIGAAGANKPDPKEVITHSTPLVPITLKCIKINFKIDAAGAHSWEDAEKLMSKSMPPLPRKYKINFEFVAPSAHRL